MFIFGIKFHVFCALNFRVCFFQVLKS